MTISSLLVIVPFFHVTRAGELGGLMGLLLGASALSIFEVFDLFIYNIFRKCLKSRDDRVKPASVAWN